MKTIIACGISLIAFSAAAAALRLDSPIAPAIGPSATAGGDSLQPLVTPDGRFVLFASTANNLALTGSNAPYRSSQHHFLNVYLRDRASNTTVLVSVSGDGVSSADQNALPTGISTNGQFALFESCADNLVPGSGTNRIWNVFLRDLVQGTNSLISINSNGIGGNGNSGRSAMTPDGRFIAFASDAADLVPGDTNGIRDVFVRDVQGGTTLLASPGAMAIPFGLSRSDAPVITPDGRYVAFYSSATNLVPGQVLAGDIYVRDLVAGITYWASAQARDLFESLIGITNTVSFDPCISDDGNYIAFESCSNAPSPNAAPGIVLRYNRSTGQTDLVCTNAFVQLASFETIQELDMTPDGRFIAFVADIGDTSGTNSAVYLWDAASGTNTLVSADAGNQLPAASSCDSPCVSSNGQYVAFLSMADLTTNAAGNNAHICLRDLVAGTTSLVNADAQPNPGGDALPGLCLSPSGQFLAFDSQQTGLTANDYNNDSDAFLYNAAGGSNELISAPQPLLPCFTADGYSTISAEPLSQDGHYLVFASGADNVVPGATNRLGKVFVRDLWQATTTLASVAPAGGPASGDCLEPVISGNGRYVAFTSAATNLVPGDTNTTSDVFVRDLQAGTNFIVSVSQTGGAGNGASHSPTISSDGRFVLFVSDATNLVPAAYTTGGNFFVRDCAAGATYALTKTGGYVASMTPDGHYIAFVPVVDLYPDVGPFHLWNTLQAQQTTVTSPFSAISLCISPDGNRIAYSVPAALTASLFVLDRALNTSWTVATNVSLDSEPLSAQFSADGNLLVYAAPPPYPFPLISQVYLYNVPAQTRLLVSHSADFSTNGDRSSGSPAISADGRFVVYQSAADNLVAGDTNGVTDVFLYDTTTGSNTILSAGMGGFADNFSFTPAFSGDGKTVVLHSWGDNLVAGDYNQFADIFTYAFLYATITATNGGNVALCWPTAPTQTFSVQYKENLTDAVWQTLNATIATNGNQACAIDPAPNAASRFYRIMSDK